MSRSQETSFASRTVHVVPNFERRRGRRFWTGLMSSVMWWSIPRSGAYRTRLALGTADPERRPGVEIWLKPPLPKGRCGEHIHS